MIINKNNKESYLGMIKLKILLIYFEKIESVQVQYMFERDFKGRGIESCFKLLN